MSSAVLPRVADKDNPYYSGLVANATLTPGAETANAINVAGKLLGPDQKPIQERGSVLCYLSDDALGDSVAAAAPNGGAAIGTNGLAVPLVAGKCFLVTSEADGTFDLTITESSAKTFWLVVVLPHGRLVVAAAAFA